MNPWETERLRVLWTQEQTAWAKIVPLKKEYINIEDVQIPKDISIFNDHYRELMKVLKKKPGIGAGFTYASMAMSIVGMNWAAFIIGAADIIAKLIDGPKIRKRVNQLMAIMEGAKSRIENGMKRLGAIQVELSELLGITERVKTEQAVMIQQDIKKSEVAMQAKHRQERALTAQRDVEIQRIRQFSPNRLTYPLNEL